MIWSFNLNFFSNSWNCFKNLLFEHFKTFFQKFSYHYRLKCQKNISGKIKCKVEKILKGSLDSIQSPSTLVKMQIMGGKVGLRSKGKTLLWIVNKLFVFKSLLTMPSNVLPLLLKPTFLPIIWIFTEVEEDGIVSRLSS